MIKLDYDKLQKQTHIIIEIDLFSDVYKNKLSSIKFLKNVTIWKTI